MAFEVFTRKSRPTSTAATVGIQKRGTISLNAAAYQALMETRGKRAIKEDVKGTKHAKDVFIEFLFDRERNMAGMRLAASDSQNAYPLRKQQAAESYLVTGKAFLEYHKIRPEKLQRYAAQLIDGVLAFPVDVRKSSASSS